MARTRTADDHLDRRAATRLIAAVTIAVGATILALAANLSLLSTTSGGSGRVGTLTGPQLTQLVHGAPTSTTQPRTRQTAGDHDDD